MKTLTEIFIPVWLLLGALVSGFFIPRMTIKFRPVMIIACLLALIISIGLSAVFILLREDPISIILPILTTVAAIAAASVFGGKETWPVMLLTIIFGWIIGGLITNDINYSYAYSDLLFVSILCLIGIGVGTFIKFRKKLP